LCQLGLIGTHHFSDLLSTLVEMERGHGLDLASCCDVIGIVDVDLYKRSLGSFFRKLFKDRADETTWAAPVVLILN
jgi:hypothetical protein